MGDSVVSKDEASTGKEEQLSSKVLSGIAKSGKKAASSGSNVLSGIKSGTGKVASSGSNVMHKITSPIESAVRHTVDKASNSLHGNTSAATEHQASTEVDTTTKGDSTSTPKVDTAPEEEQVAKSAAGSSGPGGKTSDPIESSSATESTKPTSKDESGHGFLGSVENVTNKLLVTPVKGATEKVAQGGNKLLVTPAKSAAHYVAEGGKKVLHISSHGTSKEIDQVETTEDLADVPPDDTLKKMNVIINKRLKDVSIADYYAIAWSEGNGTDKAPLYGPWLKESGKQDINVGEWQFAEDGKEFVGDWDGEKYSQKRIVTFVFNKQIPFQMGPTLAKVKHTQYCRVEGNDKCIVAMTIEMAGVPYSDCFKVEIRWVATRSGQNDIAVQVGLFVNFVKSTIMASKIRSGTTDQTTQQQVQLFRTIKKACGAVSEEVVEPKEEDDTAGNYKCSWISNVFPFMHKDALADRSDEVAVSAKSADKKMKEVITVLGETDPAETDAVVLDQLVVVNDALDKILAT